MSDQANYNYFGYIGKILKINLTNNSIIKKPLNLKYAESFIGGAGYACRYLIDFLDKDLNPLSPENILMIMTGPLCLTNAPSFGRFVICSKSPYTRQWGESNCGGFLGPELKKAGYDGIVITGKADKPSYIKIVNNDVEILDATSLWGKGVKETRQTLKDSSQESKTRVICIGQAGENLINYANLNADGRSAGRTGMGAIMGSKNLKAITIKGDKFKPNIANPPEFKATVKKTIKFILNVNATKILREYGTAAGVMPSYAHGDLPIKYWSQGIWKDVFDISGEKLKENQLIMNVSCYSCSIACGRIVEITDDEHSVPECEGPEYETIAGFGSMILNNNLESIAIANDLCNDYGLDTISASGSIAFLYNLYNKGKVNKDDVDGLELNWGNSESMLKLVEKIAFRSGIGNLLADGSIAVGMHFNVSKDEIAAINNLEPPYHDIRACYGLALTYAFSPRGACHMTGDVYKALRKDIEIDFSSIDIKKMDLFLNNREMAYGTAKLQDYRMLYSSLVSCAFSNPPPKYIADLVETLIGYDFDLGKIKIVGERIFTLKRLFNIKMGLTANNDTLPKILLTPLNEGAVKGKAPDFEKLKKHYYEVRNWDPLTGKPNIEKLKELGLDRIKF
jgi:aldehyde:ferredoxin oxidoreductase